MVVLPDTVDAQIGPQKPFTLESGFFKHANGPFVTRNTGSLDAMEMKRRECIVCHQSDGFDHIAFSGVALAHPVADMAGLSDPMADISERYAPEQIAQFVVEDKKGNRGALGEILPVSAKPLSPRRSVQLILGPPRLPWFEECTALTTKIGPLLEVDGIWRAQRYPFAGNNRKVSAEEREGEHEPRRQGSDGDFARGHRRAGQQVCNLLVGGQRADRPDRRHSGAGGEKASGQVGQALDGER